jgi:hypothetical protein
MLVHEWRTQKSVCRVVQRTSSAIYTPKTLPRVVFPTSGILDPRTAQPFIASVTSLKVGTGGGTPFTGSVQFVASGYNLTVTSATRQNGPRTVTRLTFSAIPGSGLGTSPGCTGDTNPGIRTINQQPGDPKTGNISLADDACLWLRPHWPAPHPGLKLGNDCGPCCDCDDYVATQEQILGTWNLLVDAGSVAHQTRNDYQDALARWERQKSCREAQTVLVNALAYDAYVDVAAGVCNATMACAGHTTLQSTLTSSSGETIPATLDPTGSYQTDSTGTLQETALTQATDDSVTASWVQIAPKSVAVVRLRFVLAGSPPDSLIATAVSGTTMKSITLAPG